MQFTQIDLWKNYKGPAINDVRGKDTAVCYKLVWGE